MNQLEERKFGWFYAFFGSLGVALGVLAKDDGVSSPAGIAAFACFAVIPVLLVVERARDIASWMRGSRHGVRFRPAALASSFLMFAIGFAIGSQILATDAAAQQGSAGYAGVVSRLLSSLDHDRARANGRFAAAGDRGTRNQIASELSQRFDRAASMFRNAEVPAADRTATKRMIRCLLAVGRAYARVAKALVDPAGSQAELDIARHHVFYAAQMLWKSQKALAGKRYAIASSAS